MNTEKVRTRRLAIEAMVQGATTPGEKEAAERALARHVERYGDLGEPPAKRLRPQYPGTRVGISRWWNNGPAGEEGTLYYATPPYDADTRNLDRVFMVCVTLRRRRRSIDRKCSGCRGLLRPGERAWRAVAYNGNHRMDRFCCICFAPDPKALPKLKGPPP